MGRPRKKYKTFHLSVPEEDTEIAEWMSVQFSQSASVRELIRDAICNIGMCDLFTGRSFDRKPGQSGRASGSLAVYEKTRAQERKERMQQEERAETAVAENATATTAKATKTTFAPSQRNTSKGSNGKGIDIGRDVLAELHPTKRDTTTSEEVEKTEQVAANDNTTLDDIMSMLDG